MDPIEQALYRTLVVRCQLGDRQALEDLFLRHNPRLGYYLRRMLSRDDVEDVQQEVWLNVIRRIGRLRSPEAFTVWLYQIADVVRCNMGTVRSRLHYAKRALLQQLGETP